MVRGYIALSLAVVFEICGTTMLKMSEGFTHLLPSAGAVIGFGLAFYSLSRSLRTVPLSLAYAIWSGVGTVLTALIGVAIWDEAFGVYTMIGIAAIVGGVILLNVPDRADNAASQKLQG
ncbi:Multidrug resistance protein EbrA [Paenibacillus solanacearum]|uniref:Multidrug resistance protein EbrA n=1 Tax=Paenibacillus solanacearum TaxID=2048548 RepID=A0A916JSC1_9BACL|nr:multidrug efflux SMR transporter [Paenibacillus solanacearum]CAG7599536.1 Multidrug resistance protein EbrA [Paenibacillus solanacearum]